VILADSSAWVEYDRATGSSADHRLHALLSRPSQLAVTDPIVMEVVAGARDDGRELALRRLLRRCQFIPFDAAADFDGAIRIYRTCRAAGVTPRGLIDCMIAAVARRTDASLLAHDSDLVRIAGVFDIPLDAGSSPADGVDPE
jgi:predicted nucleic acid-binding protein